MVNLPNNTLLTAYNDSPTRRTPLALATSTNGGKTWTRVAVVEDAWNGSFHYPNVFYVPKDVRPCACQSVREWKHCHVLVTHLACDTFTFVLHVDFVICKVCL